MEENRVETKISASGSDRACVGSELENRASQVAENRRHDFSARDCVFAWISFVAGYLLCRVIPVAKKPLGAFLFIIVLFAVSFAVFLSKGKRLKPSAFVAAAVSVALSASFILSGNGRLNSWNLLLCFALYLYFVYSATGSDISNGFSNLIAGDFLRALFIFPFCSFGSIYRAAFSGKSSGGVKIFGKIMLGLAISIVPTVVVIILLSYDSAFSEIISEVLSFRKIDIFSNIWSIILGVPIGMYIFGLYASSVSGKYEGIANAEKLYGVAEACHFASAATVGAALIPLLAVYCIFFISQWQYYISGFEGILPKEFSYAEYAREGFFQLLAVSVINLVIIVAAVVFTKRKTNRSPIALRVISVLYALATLVLVSTALAKMKMYIENYGLTVKRVFSSAFMIAIAVIFILITVKQFAPSFKVIPLSLAVSVAVMATLAFANVGDIVVTYNVERYISNDLSTVDIAATYELGNAAVPELTELAKTLDQRYGGDITSERTVRASAETRKLYVDLRNRLNYAVDRLESDDGGLFCLDVSKLKARSALKEIGFEIE